MGRQTRILKVGAVLAVSTSASILNRVQRVEYLRCPDVANRVKEVQQSRKRAPTVKQQGQLSLATLGANVSRFECGIILVS